MKVIRKNTRFKSTIMNHTTNFFQSLPVHLQHVHNQITALASKLIEINNFFCFCINYKYVLKNSRATESVHNYQLHHFI